MVRRGWDYGDRYISRWQYEGGIWSDWSGPDMCNDDGGGFPATGPDFEIVWLPRLDQLIDLLEDEVGHHWVRFDHWPVFGASIYGPFTGEVAFKREGRPQRWHAEGESREEAALRLLLSVRSRNQEEKASSDA